MTSYTDLLIGLFSGLFSGIIVGLAIERLRLKNELKIERVKRLAPYLELAHPILEMLKDDVDYMIKLQKRGNGESTLIESTAHKDLRKYQLWFKQFREMGLKPELEHTNPTLYAFLDGLSVHARMVAKYGNNHILNNHEDIKTKAEFCIEEIKNFLIQ